MGMENMIVIIVTTLVLFIVSYHSIAIFLKICSIIKRKLGMQKHYNAEQRHVRVISYNQSGGITTDSVSAFRHEERR